jgi:hypothetical protein
MTSDDLDDEHAPDGTSGDTSILGTFGRSTGDETTTGSAQVYRAHGYDTGTVGGTPGESDGPGGGAFDDDEDDEWLQEITKRRLPRSTAVIGATLLAALLLLGGTQIEKQYGASSAAAAAPGGGTLPTGLPTGFSGAGNAGGAGVTGGSGGGPASSTGQAAVIGTVVKVSGDTVIVKDIGGTKHTVTILRSVTIERRQNIKATQLKAGESVTVNGQTRSDGHVEATSVTAR